MLKLSLKLNLVRFLMSIIKQLEQSNKGYKTYRAWYISPASYPEYLQATFEWKQLERRYGNWSAVHENEPQEAARLERILA
jgi:hypothetical protein